MTPADAAAYAALDLAPGAPWASVHAAWRGIVKLHHPDTNRAGDHRRLQEANAAYSHLSRRLAIVDAEPGRLVCRRRSPLARRALWDLLWDTPRWGSWMPGVQHVEKIAGVCDQRRSLRGTWNGRRFDALVVLTGITPPCRLTGAVLELRIGRQVVPFARPPRVFASLRTADTGTDVELGIALHPDEELPPVMEAALQAALVELLDLAAPLELQAPSSEARSASKPG
jgi:hypothetical protein